MPKFFFRIWNFATKHGLIRGRGDYSTTRTASLPSHVFALALSRGNPSASAGAVLDFLATPGRRIWYYAVGTSYPIISGSDSWLLEYDRVDAHTVTIRPQSPANGRCNYLIPFVSLDVEARLHERSLPTNSNVPSSGYSLSSHYYTT